MILDEGELWEIVENPVVPPTYVVLLAEFQRQNKRAKRTILDAVKDHVIPHISCKDYAYQMWQSLCSLYQSPNKNCKMVLQEKLRGTKMGKTNTINSYLSTFSQIEDELSVVGDIVDSSKLVRTTLNGFTKSWESFVHGIMAHEHMPIWERLWDDFIQEETRRGSRSTSHHQGFEDGDEVDLAFVAKDKTKTK
jgi:hypothetical protein